MKREKSKKISGRTDGSLSPSAPLCQAASDESRERPFNFAGRSKVGSVASGQKLATLNLPRWQIERMRRLNKVFLAAERRIERGQKLTRAFKQFVSWLKRKPRFYRCDPAKRFRISEKHLIRLLYVWREGGRVPEVLALRYRSGRPKIEAHKVQKFALACLKSGISSLRQAHETLKRPGGSMHGFRHALPIKQRAAITTLFSARRAANRMEKKARTLLEANQ